MFNINQMQTAQMGFQFRGVDIPARRHGAARPPAVPIVQKFTKAPIVELQFGIKVNPAFVILKCGCHGHLVPVMGRFIIPARFKP